MTPRYIDANRIQWYSKWLTSGDERVFAYQDEGDNIPTADVEEVRHGEWIPLKQKKHWADTETISTDIVGFCCSECGAEEKFKHRYCHCGAKMDGKEK